MSTVASVCWCCLGVVPGAEQNKALVMLNGPLCDNLYKPMNKKAPRVEYPTEVRLSRSVRLAAFVEWAVGRDTIIRCTSSAPTLCK